MGVLIDDRNALKAARLAWIATKNLTEEKKAKRLTLVGAVHVEGITELLRDHLMIREELARFGLSFLGATPHKESHSSRRLAHKNACTASRYQHFLIIPSSHFL